MKLSQPNILFMQVDQLAASMLECYGNRVVDAPHIARLAQTGTVFESAYSNFPLCAPSRFSMMSGQLASVIGAYDNGAEFASSIPTLAHYLRSLDYQTCLVGKMHFIGADQLHGFEERLTTDIYPADFGWTGDWTEIKQRHSNDIRSFTQAGICIRNPQMEYDDEVAHRAERKLYDLARRRDQRPFFLQVSFTHPHDPYQCREEHWRRYDHDLIDNPRTGRLEPTAMDPYSARLYLQYGLNEYQPSEHEVRVARHAYYGSISYVDDHIGRLLKVLRETAFDADTVIVFTSDHGDMLGEKGLWYKKSFFEDSVRVPLIITAPGVDANRVSQPVSLVDLLPTLTELAAGDRPSPIVEDIEGRSLCPSIFAEDEPDRVVYSENLAEGALEPIVMARSGPHKFISSGMDPDQLFNLESDPEETNNLANHPEQSNLTQDMRALIAAKWDLEKLAHDVRASQNRRLFLGRVMGPGTSFEWDYQPRDQATDHVLRADRSYNDWAYDDIVGFKRP